MAYPLSTKKRIRQAEKARLKNKADSQKMKALIKDVKRSTDKKDAETKLVNTISHIDKVAHKNIIHKNKASRLKGKLQKVVNEMK